MLNEIVFGLPGVDLWEARERGEIALGGCVIEPVDRRCRRCECEWANARFSGTLIPARRLLEVPVCSEASEFSRNPLTSTFTVGRGGLEPPTDGL